MAFTEELVVGAVVRATGGTSVTYQGRVLDFAPPWPRVSLLEAVSEKVGERVHQLDPVQLEHLCRRHHVETRPGMGAGGLLDGLFSDLVQAELVRPTFVVKFAPTILRV